MCSMSFGMDTYTMFVDEDARGKAFQADGRIFARFRQPPILNVDEQ